MNPLPICNSSELLHPHLMETSSIIEYLKHRQLQIPNIEQKTRDELLKIFQSYAVPLHKRSSARTKTTDDKMDTAETMPAADTPKPGMKHKLIVYDSKSATNSEVKTLDWLTNG
ncbi:hypothetical protein Bhyg_11774 [Pseudolycoriella hygida]|uniref:Ashwin n=1 Tax=Pseudolycoriella hygida TaxID=35572 RepID=A0A9Q0MXS4_9DIPT|nr:hypothetical protein Bhyg_11774 [Pseudolycoriella hygida]